MSTLTFALAIALLVAALAAIGFAILRVTLGQTDDE